MIGKKKTKQNALICLTACYPKKFGPRGIGHAGLVWIGLQCDIEDEGYARPAFEKLPLQNKSYP